MMTNLFSSFDPSTFKLLSLNWLILIFIFLSMPFNFFMKNNPFWFIWKKMINFLSNEFKMIMQNNLVQGSMNMIIAIFIMIFCSNLMGLFPFIFTSTSHLVTTLMMSLSIWLSLFLFSILNNLKMFFAHLVPNSTPGPLMMFMVLIETVSQMIRPITLSVRLAANMIAGHILLTLLGNSFFSFNFSIYSFLYISQFMLLILELAVAMIQAYVFTMLMILYSIEA